MKRVLVVGLAMVLATAGSAFADGKSSNNSSSTTTGSTSSDSSSGSSAGQQGAARPSTASRSSGNRAPGAPPYPANAAVQNNVPRNANARLRVLDRAEPLARQAA